MRCSCLTSKGTALRCNGLAGFDTVSTPKKGVGAVVRWLVGGREQGRWRDTPAAGRVGFGWLLAVGGSVVAGAKCGGRRAGGEGVEARAALRIGIWVVPENFIWQKGVLGRRMVCRENLQRVLIVAPLKHSRPLIEKPCDWLWAGGSPTPSAQGGSSPSRANSVLCKKRRRGGRRIEVEVRDGC